MSYSFNLDGPSSLNKNVPDVRYFFAQFRVNFEKFARSISVAFRVIASTHNTKYKRDFRISLAPIEFLTTAVLIKTYQNVRLHCPTIIGIFKFGRLPHFWQWRKSISKIGFACNDMALIWQTIFQPVGKMPHVTPDWPIRSHFDICVGYILSDGLEFDKAVDPSQTLLIHQYLKLYHLIRRHLEIIRIMSCPSQPIVLDILESRHSSRIHFLF